jgi:DNA-binding MarR family transcriptional regulator
MSLTATHKVEALRALEQEMGILVRRIRRVIVERARAVDPELQIAGYLVLSFLADSGPARSADVVEALGIDKGAISRHVQHLTELGLVDRQPDPLDGRAAILNVTDEGVRRLAVLAEHRRTNLDEKLADWTVDDLGEFVQALSRYNRSLG